MDNHSHHSTPSISIMIGMLTGVVNYVAANGFFFDSVFQLFKIIAFGMVGGASGYIGKLLVLAFNRKMKNKKS